MTGALILDTGAWLLALAGEEPWATEVEQAPERIVPGLVLAELDYHLRDNRRAVHHVLSDIAQGAYRYEPPTLGDLERAREIDEKFRTVEPGLVDASVAALAERLAVYRVLTIDADFYSLRIGRRFERALELPVPPPRRRGGKSRGGPPP